LFHILPAAAPAFSPEAEQNQPGRYLWRCAHAPGISGRDAAGPALLTCHPGVIDASCRRYRPLPVPERIMPHSLSPFFFCQRAEKEINGHPQAPGLFKLCHAEFSVEYRNVPDSAGSRTHGSGSSGHSVPASMIFRPGKAVSANRLNHAGHRLGSRCATTTKQCR